MNINIVKRNGKTQPLKLDKITTRIKKQLFDLDLNYLNPDMIAISVVGGLFEGATTRQIDELIAEQSASKATSHPDYSKLASRILVSSLHKDTEDKFSNAMLKLVNDNLISKDFYNLVEKYSSILDDNIKNERDFNFDYFGFKTLQRSYLLKDLKNNIVERPQYLYMRIALAICKDNIDDVIKTYDLLSEGYYTHATPTMFNAGTNLQQLSSCFLLKIDDDSLDEIYKILSDTAKISKLSGGIGISISKIRAKNSKIKGTNGTSDGIIPMLKVYNETARYVNQCFAPETIIYTNNGIKRIDSLKEGDLVLTKEAKYCEVGEVMKYQQKDGMIEIKTKSSITPLRLTDSHPIYAISNTYKNSELSNSLYYNQLEKNIITPKWIPSGQLKVGDFIGKPIPKEIIDVEDFTEDDALIYGLMLGDGHISGYECGLSFHTFTNIDSINFVRNYLKNKNIHFWEYVKNDNYTAIRWSLSKIDWLKYEYLYDENKLKRIHQKFYHLPLNKTINIIKGLIKSDGGVYRGNEIVFNNNSLPLIEDLSYQILRFGVPTYGNWKEVENNSLYLIENGCIKKTSYRCVLRIPSFKELSKILGVEEVTKKNWLIWDGILYTKIVNIDKLESYDDFVYDLKIKEQFDDPSYTISQALVHNGGKRKGSFAIYIEPWHDDIFDFVDLRKNHGKEEMRARDLFLAIWTNDLFMEAVVNDTDWYLMCPNESPGLHDCYGQEFKDLYEKYIIEGNFRRKIKARDLWSKIIENQIETGVPYILHKDSINEKSNQKNIGVISSSNLCCEIVEYTSKEEQSVCNLSSIGLPKLVNENGFDFNKLYDVAYMSIKNLDRVIDINYYPTNETQLSNSKHRPVGSGINGLADVFAMLKLPFDSVEAKELSKKISETIYFASLTASNDLAIEKGKYSTFDGSPTSKGILQYDMWENRTVANNKILNSEPIKLSGMWDFDSLKEKIIKYGLRNSLLTTILPSASTAQILGNNECIEPFTSNIYSRKTLSGEFVLTNKHLIKELIDLKLWSDDIRKKIIINNGSVQNIEEIPSDIRYRYRTVWEMKMKDIIDMSADRAPFICQTQSLNLFFKDINYAKLTGSLIYGWLKGLKTGSYYIRQDVSTKANNMLGIDTTTSKKSEIEEIACSLDNPEDCLACSA